MHHAMRCDQFEDRLQALLDERRRPERDALLEEHAQSCPECRSRLLAQEVLFDQLELWEDPLPSDDFAVRVVARAWQPALRTFRPAAPRRWLVVAASIAAILTVAAIPIAGKWLKSDDVGPRVADGGSPAVPSPAEPRVDVDSGSGLAIVQPVESAPTLRQALPGWVRGVDGRWVEAPRQHMDELAGELRPIATSLQAALTALRRSIPVGKARAMPEPRTGASQKADIHDWTRIS